MPDASSLLPLKFGSFQIRPLAWSDFAGEVDHTLAWSAHIFWSIEYKIVDEVKGKIAAHVSIGKRSWARDEKKCSHLLNHQQGHYLIGALCALQFMRRVDSKRGNSSEKFEDMVARTFERTMKEFLELEKKYDIETEHRLNWRCQEKWDKHIKEKLEFYVKIYDRKKARFCKLAESPTKGR